MTGSYDREAFTGPIDTNHWLFISDYSPQLWSLLFCERKELINYIINGIEPPEKLVPDPRNIVRRMAELKTIALTKIEEFELGLSDIKAAIDALNEPLLNEKLKCLFPTMKKVFQDIGYIENEKVNFRALYSSVLYLKLFRIHEGGGVIQGNIKGFSVAGFTAKDFMSCFTKGKKKVYGNPYVKKEKIKGIGEVKSMLTKASGQLEIKLDIDINKAIELKTMIDNAGVSAFYLGKKGLAYVSHIDVR